MKDFKKQQHMYTTRTHSSLMTLQVEYVYIYVYINNLLLDVILKRVNSQLRFKNHFKWHFKITLCWSLTKVQRAIKKRQPSTNSWTVLEQLPKKKKKARHKSYTLHKNCLIHLKNRWAKGDLIYKWCVCVTQSPNDIIVFPEAFIHW